MDEDSRMYFISNIDDFNDEHDEREVYEEVYEVYSHGIVTGSLDYGPYRFSIWEFPINTGEVGKRQRLFLRIRKVEKPLPVGDEWPPKGSGYYFIGGIPNEIVSLSSLFLARRIELGPQVFSRDKPMIIPQEMTGYVDKNLMDGECNLGDLGQWFDLVAGLDERYHHKFMLATKFYHLAVLLIEKYPDMAYLNLISSIEVLCQDTVVENPTIDEGLRKVIGECVEEEAKRIRLEEAIIKRERRTKKKFTQFIINHVEKDFWEQESRIAHYYHEQVREDYFIKEEELRTMLDRIYDQRSRTIHNGKPFPVTTFDRHDPRLQPPKEMPGPVYIGIPGRTWSPDELVPYPHFFEGLVNHVLKTFLKRNQALDSNLQNCIHTGH